MRNVLLLVAVLFGLNLHAAEPNEDMYIVVTALYKPGIEYSLRSRTAKSRVICYPITYKKELFYEKAVEEAAKNYILGKDDKGVIEDLTVHTFEDRNEAIKLYKELTTDSGKRDHKRISFSRAHIDKSRKLFLAEIEALKEKEKPVEKVILNKAIDDIYN